MTVRDLQDDLRIFLRSRRSPPHVHRCPECYVPWPCVLPTCTIEPDLALDSGLPCGFFEVCLVCRRNDRRRLAFEAAREELLRAVDGGASLPEVQAELGRRLAGIAPLASPEQISRLVRRAFEAAPREPAP